MLITILIILVVVIFLLSKSIYNKHSVIFAASLISLLLTTFCLMFLLAKFSTYRYYFRLEFYVYSLIARIQIDFFSVKQLFSVAVAIYFFLQILLAINLYSFKNKRNKIIMSTASIALILVFLYLSSPAICETLYIAKTKSTATSNLFALLQECIVFFNYSILLCAFFIPFTVCLITYRQTKIFFIKNYMIVLIIFLSFIASTYFILVCFTPLKYYFENCDIQNFYITSLVYDEKLFITYPCALFVICVTLSFLLIKFKMIDIVNIFQTNIKKKRNKIVLGNIRHVFHTCKNSLMVVIALQEKILNAKDLEECKNIASETKSKTFSFAKHLEECLDIYNNQVQMLQNVSIMECLDNAVEMLPKNNNILIDKSYINNIEPLIINADKSSVVEMVYNLLKNSVESISKDQNGIIKISIYTSLDWICVSIYDNGSGINKRALNKIFRPLYSSKKTAQNWGLGLYQANCIANAHLGFINIQSKVQEFTEVQVVLPNYYQRKTLGGLKKWIKLGL